MLLKTKDLVTMAILLSINLIFVVFASILESNTLTFYGLAAFIIYIVIYEYDISKGLVFYFASAALGFFLALNKLHVITYILIFAPYVFIKYKVKNIIARVLYANVLAVIFYLVVRFILIYDVKLIYVVLFEIGIVIYDYALKFALIIYNDKMRPHFKK